jgi:hypothetical protein
VGLASDLRRGGMGQTIDLCVSGKMEPNWGGGCSALIERGLGRAREGRQLLVIVARGAATSGDTTLRGALRAGA